MSVTIKEIALRTGLSIPTVGNVLGRSASRYSAATRKRVLQAAQEMGYKPNSSARAMRQGRFGCAALVLSRSKQQTHSHIPVGLLDGLDDSLARHDIHLTVSRLTDEELSSDDFLPKVLRQSMTDGMIVNYTHEIPQGMLDLIHAHHAPAVWLNAKLKEDCVYPDDFAAAQSATARLIGLGHRRIALLHLISPNIFATNFEQAKPKFHYSVSDRAAGYATAMLDAGLSPIVTHHDRYIDNSEQLDACRALLRGENRPTAVVVYSDRDLSLLMCAASELGLSVPKDLSVLVFYPTDVWSAGKSVSAIQVPTSEMGRRAVAMLMQKIESPNESCSPVAVPYDARFGETVAPASK
ncbi:MAG TPA: LacI family DNA-binding transcriptional regulator [Tepidisphaeraceae bacterium]|jgi:LacI family transcriptional regulator|nr:LacI family DNA-binding transcriptional regulator [Tepidisphaeraceae bacterium]